MPSDPGSAGVLPGRGAQAAPGPAGPALGPGPLEGNPAFGFRQCPSFMAESFNGKNFSLEDAWQQLSGGSANATFSRGMCL